MTPDETTSADGSPALPPCSFCGNDAGAKKEALYTACDRPEIAVCGDCVLSMTRTSLGVPDGVDVVIIALPPAVAQVMLQPMHDAMPSKAKH